MRKKVLKRGWNNIPIRAKVLAIMAVPVLALVAATASFLVVGHTSNQAQDAVVEALRVRQAIQDVEAARNALESELWTEVLAPIPMPASGDASRQLLVDKTNVLRELVASDPEQLEALEGYEDGVVRRLEITKIAMKGLLAEIDRTGSVPDLSAYFGDPDSFDEIDSALAAVQTRAEETLEQRTLDAKNARDRVQATVFLAAGVGAGGGILLVFLTMGGLIGRIKQVGENAGRLARGERLLEVNGAKDEIGRLARELYGAADLLARREQELRDAKDEAERSNKAKTEFLSRMSHELRTPLNSVLGFGQLLAMRETDAEAQDSAEQIIRAGRHLLSLIDEVLDISRIEVGRLRLSPEPVQVEEIIRETIDLLRPIAEHSKIRLDSAVGSDVWVLADRQRIKQVFLNVVSNAVKYNRPDGSATIHCDLDDERVQVHVTDTGHGIAADDIAKLFVPFERLNADALGVEGTGLGLALSHRLVEAMHGRMTVESNLGEGSTFTVELPVAAPAPAQAGDAPTPPRERLHEGEPTVLYIEDNLANLRLVERILSRVGPVGLLTTMQGGLGLEMARQHRPDLILLDLHLPDMHGGDVLAALQGDASTRDIPVIIITADATPASVRAALQGGARACMTKPLDVLPFMQLVEEYLRPSRVVA